MRCRALVQSEASKKQNIVWFGSCGKNEDYTPMSIVMQQEGQPASEDGRAWKTFCLDLFVLDGEPFLNESPQWGETALWPSETLLPSSGEDFRKISQKPSDWDSDKYKYTLFASIAWPRTFEADAYYADPGDGLIDVLQEEPEDWGEGDYLEISAESASGEFDPSAVYGERIPPLYPNSGERLSYFKYDESTGAYKPIKTMPDDWKDHYMDYYIAYFSKNTSSVYDPSIIYYAHDNKIPAKNYSERSQGVRDGLIQRLSVIKGELWYKASYGLPLTEKIKNKGIYDSIVINIITTHPDISNLISYRSSVNKATREYEFEFQALTVYSEEVKIRYTI